MPIKESRGKKIQEEKYATGEMIIENKRHGVPVEVSVEDFINDSNREKEINFIDSIPSKPPVDTRSTGHGLNHISRPVTGSTLHKTWRIAWKRSRSEKFMPIADPTRKEVGQLNHMIRRWRWDRRELHFFLAWVVSRWPDVLAAMPWLKRPPEHPSVGWVLAVFDQLADLWAEQIRLDFINDMTNDRLERLIAMGVTPGTRDLKPQTSRFDKSTWSKEDKYLW